MLKFNSIKTKLVLFNILLMLLTVVIFIGIVIDLDKRSLSPVRGSSEALITTALQSEWEDKSKAVTNLLSNRLVQPMHNFDIFEMKNIVMLTMEEKDISYIYIHDEDGRILVAAVKGSEAKGAELMGKMPDDELTKKAAAADEMLVQKNGDVVDIAAPVMLGQNRLSVVRVGFSNKGIQNTISGMIKGLNDGLDKAVSTAINNVLLAAVIVGILLIVIALLLSNRLLVPIYELINGTKKIAAGDLTYKIDVKSTDEIGRLADSFNSMTKDMHRYHSEKEKILKDMHDGIGGITTNIKLLSELAQDKQSVSEIKETLNTISELSREGLSEIRNFILSLDIKETNWQALTAEMRSFGRSMIEPHGISFNMSSSVEELAEQPTSLVYLNIFRAYKEALTNIMKHSKAKAVEVSLSVNAQSIMLSIKDDGVGLKEENRLKGRGITNMIMRARELGGQLTIASDKGTQIALEIPLPIRYLNS